MTFDEMDALIKSGIADCYECDEQIDTTDKDNYCIINWFCTKDVDIRCMRCYCEEKFSHDDVREPQDDYNDLD
jgi:hypothetical protein